MCYALNENVCKNAPPSSLRRVHANLTPPDVIELDPEVWLRLACGITTWAEEKDAGHISAVGERDDLSDLLPL